MRHTASMRRLVSVALAVTVALGWAATAAERGGAARGGLRHERRRGAHRRPRRHRRLLGGEPLALPVAQRRHPRERTAHGERRQQGDRHRCDDRRRRVHDHGRVLPADRRARFSGRVPARRQRERPRRPRSHAQLRLVPRRREREGAPPRAVPGQRPDPAEPRGVAERAPRGRHAGQRPGSLPVGHLDRAHRRPPGAPPDERRHVDLPLVQPGRARRSRSRRRPGPRRAAARSGSWTPTAPTRTGWSRRAAPGCSCARSGSTPTRWWRGAGARTG